MPRIKSFPYFYAACQRCGACHHSRHGQHFRPPGKSPRRPFSFSFIGLSLQSVKLNLPSVCLPDKLYGQVLQPVRLIGFPEFHGHHMDGSDFRVLNTGNLFYKNIADHLKLSFRASAHTGVGIPRMFGNLQENLRPVNEIGLKPWGIAPRAFPSVTTPGKRTGSQ